MSSAWNRLYAVGLAGVIFGVLWPPVAVAGFLLCGLLICLAVAGVDL